MLRNKSRLYGFLAMAGLVMLGVSLWGAQHIPAGARVPIHWDINGNPDGWGSRNQVLWMTPIMSVFVLGLIQLVRSFDPRKEHVEQSNLALNNIMAGIVCFMLVIHTALVLVSSGYPLDMGAVTLTTVGLFFAFLGNFLSKIRSNYFAGIRTPWTLSSERSWVRTNRLTGWLFVVVGMLTALSAFVSVKLATLILLVGTFGGIAVAVVYSYFVWRSDPNKTS